MNHLMGIGDLVRDQNYGLVGIIISEPHAGPDYHNGDKTDWHDFGVLYEDGHIFGADEGELEVLS